MKITMYELLGLVKDNKAPKKIMYENELYFYEPFTKDYYDCEGKISEINLFHGVNRELNREVEIIEEGKKIPDKLGLINYCEDQATLLIHHKVDEIIDYLKSKGDK